MEDKMEAATDSCEIVQRYAGQIAGQLRCWDRLVVTGTLLEVGYSGALSPNRQHETVFLLEKPASLRAGTAS
jgi:hypothetical protein